jgi:hypothetical protein
MRRIIFYSWQSDLPNPTNRGFIQTALEAAAEKIKADDTVAVEPVVDRDTKNVPGSPDIASTIFTKITGADIFVADVSIVVRAENMRPSPNPNVLIELGYAIKTLGHERIILVFNKSFGKIEELPFDLRTRRVLVYEMTEKEKDRATERKKVEGQLEEAIRAALEVLPEDEAVSQPNPVINAIEETKPNRRIILRQTLTELLKKIAGLEPKKHRDGGTVDELIAGIRSTQEIVAEFSKVAEAITVMKDMDSAMEVYHWFGKLFEKYNLPQGYNGRISNADHDFFKFVGHEIFVTFIAFLIREQQWDMLADLLNEPIPMQYIPHEVGPGSVDWEYASEHLALLLDESPKKSRMSLHADLLNERHAGNGGLATIMPMQDFMDADFFLFLLSRTLKDPSGLDLRYWRAWSCLYLKNAPMFIKNSERIKFAEKIVKVLSLKNIDEYKTLLSDRGPELRKLFNRGFWDYPIGDDEIKKIGTR